jgi:phosphonate transport system permease protein
MRVAPQRAAGVRTARWGAGIAAVGVVAWSLHGTGVSPTALIEGRVGALRFLDGLLSPELGSEFLRHVGAAVLQTLQISIAGLALAAVVGLPLAVVIAGTSALPGPLRAVARSTGAFLRGVPDLLWALLFVAMIGPGPTAGVFALALHGAGLLAKLCSEQLEAVDPAPVEAVRLTGAGRAATTALAVVPQARAGLASMLLYQWECNIRTSTVLGFVGAGGIGQELAVSLRLFRYEELSTLVIAVLILILLADRLSRYIRHRLGAQT